MYLFVQNMAPASPHCAEPSTGGSACSVAPRQAVLSALVVIHYLVRNYGLPVTELLPKVNDRGGLALMN